MGAAWPVVWARRRRQPWHCVAELHRAVGWLGWAASLIHWWVRRLSCLRPPRVSAPAGATLAMPTGLLCHPPGCGPVSPSGGAARASTAKPPPCSWVVTRSGVLRGRATCCNSTTAKRCEQGARRVVSVGPTSRDAPCPAPRRHAAGSCAPRATAGGWVGASSDAAAGSRMMENTNLPRNSRSYKHTTQRRGSVPWARGWSGSMRRG